LAEAVGAGDLAVEFGFEAGDGIVLAVAEGLGGASHEGLERVCGREGGEAVAKCGPSRAS
jgi:hypothetical protein